MKIKEKLPFLLPLIFSIIVIYYPIVFGFFISPNDIYFHYDPFRFGSFEYASLNPTLNDPATSYWTKVWLFKTEPKSLFFNPYIASGFPGALDLFSGILNPFVLIPIIFPIELFFSIMVFLKIFVSYSGMYLLLKKFNLNPWACAFGGISYALFGQNIVWLLWPQTNISSLFPWFFFSLKVKNNGVRFLILFLLFLFSLTGGYPPYLLIFFYFFLFYLILVETKKIFSKFKTLILPFLFANLTLAPFLYVTYYDLKESKRLEAREGIAEKEDAFPLKSLQLFFSPYKFGKPQDFSLKANEGFYSLCFYFGIFGILFLPLGFLSLKDPEKRFFIISFVFFILIFYFNSPLRSLILKLPFLSYSPFSRITILFGLCLSIVSAFGFEWFLKRFNFKKIFLLVPLILAIDLGFFGAKFLSYQKFEKIKPPITPAISFLKENLKDMPFRVCGLYDSLWPNSSEYTKIPDIRSHFSSEGWYREFLSIADPNVSKKMGTFLLFWDVNSIKSPIFSALFVKYITEPPFINTINQKIQEKKYFEEPERYIEIPEYGLKRKVQFEGVPYSIEFYLKDIKSNVYINLYEEFSQTLLGKYDLKEKDGIFYAIIEKPWELNFSRVFLEVVAEKGAKIGIRGENFCLNISYSPYISVYEANDLKIFENRNIEEPVILTFDVRDGFPQREENFHYFSYFSKNDFEKIDEFIKKSKGKTKTGKVSFSNINLYGGDFKISTKANSVLVLPFKYNPLWAEAELDGEKVKIYKANGCMSSVLIPEGEHILSFNFGKKFIPYIFVSLFIFSISILMFLILL